MASINDRPQQRVARHAPTGRLFAQDGMSVAVSITHRGEDILLVILEDAFDFIAGPLTYLILESTGGRGVVRTLGAAEVIEPNLLRFVLDETPQLIQRREYVRVVAAKRVVFEDEESGQVAEGLTVDLSGGGMLVQLPRTAELPHGSGDLHFTLYLGLTDFDEAVGGTARVVRRTSENHVAFGFSAISRRDQERLIRYVFERQRLALRITRGDTI
jgi:hypothetical protein